MSSLISFKHIFDEQGQDTNQQVTVEWCNVNGAYQIDNQTVVSWTEEVIKHLLDNPELDYHYTLSGNMFVIGFRNEEGNIEIEVTKRHKTAFVQTQGE